MGILDHLIPEIRLRAWRGGYGLQCGLTSAGTVRRPHLEGHGRLFVFADEVDRCRRRFDLPARWRRQRHRDVGVALLVVADGHVDVLLTEAGGRRRRTAVVSSVRRNLPCRKDGDVWIDPHVERRHDLQLRALFSRQYVRIAELHDPLDVDSLAADVEVKGCNKRRRPERKAERHIRIEVVACRVGSRRPVRRGEMGTRRNRQHGLARHALTGHQRPAASGWRRSTKTRERHRLDPGLLG